MNDELSDKQDVSVQGRRSAQIPRSPVELLEKYRWDAQYLAAGHYLAAKQYHTVHVIIGILAILCSSITTTSIFGSLAVAHSTAWIVSTGLLAASATAFASLQVFLKLPERSEQHKVFGARYTSIRDNADMMLVQLGTSGDLTEADALHEDHNLAEALTTLAQDAPDLVNRIYDRARSGF